MSKRLRFTPFMCCSIMLQIVQQVQSLLVSSRTFLLADRIFWVVRIRRADDSPETFGEVKRLAMALCVEVPRVKINGP